MAIILHGEKCLLRPWRWGDEPTLIANANNRNVWRNLMDHFPYPYGREEAQNWIALCEGSAEVPNRLAIEVDGDAIGGVGVEFQEDVYKRIGLVGYWLGEDYWGRGIATEALKLATEHAFTQFDIVRLQAGVFGWNQASMRVLEKAGYNLEGIMRRAVFKDGEITDLHLYAKLRSEN